MTAEPAKCECGKEPTRRCVRCRRPVCDDCALWRGGKAEPGSERAKCVHCDYLDYQNTYGGM